MTADGCLDPPRCPVPRPNDADLRRLRPLTIPRGQVFHTSYHRRHRPDLFNSTGVGNARFSPLTRAGGVVPTMYGGITQTVVLLETTFHDVHADGVRLVSLALHLSTRGLVALVAPRALHLVDLTNEGLRRIGLAREQLVTTSPEHYACTRAWAAALHDHRGRGARPDGLLWQSRVAELARQDSPLLSDLLPRGDHVFVLFGDRVPVKPAAWAPGDPAYPDLTSGNGRLLAEQIAEHLDAVIV